MDQPDRVSWRDQAVKRSLERARLRADDRVKRFLDAASELLNRKPGRDFTLQEVEERSGQTLHVFYQFFGGKHELLLAVFEETVRSATEQIRHEIAQVSDPLECLHRFVVTYYWMCRTMEFDDGAHPGAPLGMAEFAQQVLTKHRKEAARVFSPIRDLFEEALNEAIDAKAIRTEAGRSPIVGIVLEVIMFNIFSSTIGGRSLRPGERNSAEELWELILHGVSFPTISAPGML